MVPDARKTLEQLSEEWEHCTKCALGSRRATYEHSFVFGEGARRGIMIVGEGPDKLEEELGRPFLGPAGQLVRDIMARLGVEEYYVTNVVACRPCAQAQNAEGVPMFERSFRPDGLKTPRWKDEPPQPAYAAACLDRLHQEIYLVDPVVVVTLGATAAETLLKKKVSLVQDRGRPERLSIPGAGWIAQRTEKRQHWMRKQDGKVHAPVVQNQVHFYCIPTIHPSLVLKKQADLEPHESAFRKLVEDLRLAVKVNEDYLAKTKAISATGLSDTPFLDMNFHPASDQDQT